MNKKVVAFFGLYTIIGVFFGIFIGILTHQLLHLLSYGIILGVTMDNARYYKVKKRNTKKIM